MNAERPRGPIVCVLFAEHRARRCDRLLGTDKRCLHTVVESMDAYVACEKKAGQRPAFSSIEESRRQAAWMFDACLPFGPCVTSKLTF
jgi:hypothetical protein